MANRVLFVIAAASSVACSPSTQSCVAPIAAGDLVITEVFADPHGSDGGPAWFEVYNTTDHALPLDGLELDHDRAGVATEHSHIVIGATIRPGGYLVLGAAPPDATPPYVDYGFGTDLGTLKEGGSGILELRCSGDVVAQASYAGIVSGYSRELAAGSAPSPATAAEPQAWCQAFATEFSPDEFGTPGAPSDCVPLAPGQCQDGLAARAAVAPRNGALAITEVLPNPDGDETTREWIEVSNAGKAAFDLVGLALARPGSTKPPDVIAGPACRRVAPGGYALFARSASSTANSGLPAVDATFSFSLINSNGSAEVLAADGSVLAAIAWKTSPSGASIQLSPDGSAWCDGTTPYGDGTNLGTPRAPNVSCGP
jgi:hypothetical protein